MKKVKILISFIIIVFCLFLVGGCYDSQDINEKLIVTSIAFDFKNDEIWYYLEIANIESGKSDETSSSKYKCIVLKASGKTLIEVRDKLDAQLDKPLYLSGVSSIIFTENFANEYLVEYLYRFRADETYRKKVSSVITSEDPEEIYKKIHEKNASVGFLIDGTLETMNKTGKSFIRTTMRLLENLSTKYTGILIPRFDLNENTVYLSGYSVISDSKIAGFLPLEDSKGTIFLKTNKVKFQYIIPFRDINLTIEVILNKRKIKTNYENNKITFNVQIDFEAELMYGDKKTPYGFVNEAIKEAEQTLKSVLENEMSSAIEKAQKDFECDYLQFDDVFRIKYPEIFKEMDWGNEFKNANVETVINVNLRSKKMLDYGLNEVR